MENGKFNPTFDGQEWKEFFYLSDLADYGANIEQLKNDYDHLDDLDAQNWVVLFRKHPDGSPIHEFYHVSDFLGWSTPWTGPRPDIFEQYHGYKSDTFFSMVLIALSDDCSRYKASLYY